MKMKKFTFIIGAVSLSISSLGILFKTMHWLGGGYVITAGFTILSFLFIPSLFIYLYKREK